jgi:hypothetical protein
MLIIIKFHFNLCVILIFQYKQPFAITMLNSVLPHVIKIMKINQCQQFINECMDIEWDLTT